VPPISATGPGVRTTATAGLFQTRAVPSREPVSSVPSGENATAVTSRPRTVGMPERIRSPPESAAAIAFPRVATATTRLGARTAQTRRPPVVSTPIIRPDVETTWAPANDAVTAPRRRSIATSWSPAFALQSLAVPSALPVMIVEPVESYPTDVTASVWPASGASRRPSCVE
jgi:hypothetical protein